MSKTKEDNQLLLAPGIHEIVATEEWFSVRFFDRKKLSVSLCLLIVPSTRVRFQIHLLQEVCLEGIKWVVQFILATAYSRFSRLAFWLFT